MAENSVNQSNIAEDIIPQHVRFSELPWYDPKFGPGWITVGGAGGIGSWLSTLLSRAGFVLQIWDFDTVDETNLGGQLYGAGHLGRNKAEVTQEMCVMLGAEQHILAEQTFTDKSPVSHICFSAFDNMKARKVLFESWVELVSKDSNPALFVDGRMLAESGQIYWVTRENIDVYRTQLFDDNDVKEQPCSAKATSHCGAFISSMMMAGLTNWITNQKLNLDAREVPFKAEFGLALFNITYKTAEECLPL